MDRSAWADDKYEMLGVAVMTMPKVSENKPNETKVPPLKNVDGKPVELIGVQPSSEAMPVVVAKAAPPKAADIKAPETKPPEPKSIILKALDPRSEDKVITDLKIIDPKISDTPTVSAPVAAVPSEAKIDYIEKNYENKWTEEVFADFVIGLTLFTAVLAFATIQQGRQFRQELILSQRPKLRIRNVIIKPSRRPATAANFLEEGKHVIGQFYIVNIGGTPAKIIQSDCIVYWGYSGLPMERPYEWHAPTNLAAPNRLLPGTSVTVPFQSEEPMDSAAEDINRQAGNLRLYVMGWVTYEDNLKVKRRTSFCRVYKNLTGATHSKFYPVDDADYEHEE